MFFARFILICPIIYLFCKLELTCAQFGSILAIIIHILWHETISTFLDAGMQKEEKSERARIYMQFRKMIIITTKMANVNGYVISL